MTAKSSRDRICKFTLEICDKDLEEQYTQIRYPQISYVSKHILFAKLIYGLFVNLQYFKGTVGFQRNLIY